MLGLLPEGMLTELGDDGRTPRETELIGETLTAQGTELTAEGGLVHGLLRRTPVVGGEAVESGLDLGVLLVTCTVEGILVPTQEVGDQGDEVTA